MRLRLPFLSAPPAFTGRLGCLLHVMAGDEIAATESPSAFVLSALGVHRAALAGGSH